MPSRCSPKMCIRDRISRKIDRGKHTTRHSELFYVEEDTYLIDVYKRQVLRSTLVPLANFGSTAAWPVFILGLIMSLRPLVMAGIVLFTLAVLFQLVTLPVEFNASARAIKVLESTGMLGSTEIDGAKKVLRAAAMTLSLIHI